jgi:hypothetical protein
VTKSAALALALSLVAFTPSHAQDVTEPRSGVAFPAKAGDLTLLGTGLRTKTMLKVKVYAIGLYANEAMLATHKGKGTPPQLYKDLQWGDFPKQLSLRFTRDVTTEQIQEAFREALAAQGADAAKTNQFVGFFGETKTGQEYVLRWVPGGVLETTVVGQAKPAINDKNFAAAVFGIWLGDKAIQDDIKKDLVARFTGAR